MSTASDMVSTIDTAMASIISKEAESITVNGEEYTALNIEKLGKVREKYAAIVATENATANSTAPIGITGLSAGNAR